jgi:hypothetical protein
MVPILTFRTPLGFHFRTRGIGFLEGEDELDAGREFDGLEEKEQQNVRNRIDHWLGRGVFKKYHHGFDAPDHRNCYVFKFQSIRFYGFLCHPRPTSDRGFQLCVLTSCVGKHQWNTEPVLLNRAVRMLAEVRSKVAISTTYPEYHKRKVTWPN